MATHTPQIVVTKSETYKHKKLYIGKITSKENQMKLIS